MKLAIMAAEGKVAMLEQMIQKYADETTEAVAKINAEASSSDSETLHFSWGFAKGSAMAYAEVCKYLRELIAAIKESGCA